MKALWLAAIAAVVLGAWTSSDAQPGGRRFLREPGKMARDLGLTDEQKNKMQEIRMASQKEMIRLGADLRIARLELEEVIRQSSPKPEDVKARLAVLSAAQGKMLEKRVNLRLEMKKILTPEQQEKVKGMMMQRGMGGMGLGVRGWGRMGPRFDVDPPEGVMRRNWEGRKGTEPE